MTSSGSPAPVLFERQRQLLALIEAAGGCVDDCDFQRLLCLYSHDGAVGSPYEFVPGRFGAFSFTAAADGRKLVSRGLLVDAERHWQITAAGRQAIAGRQDPALASFLRRHGLRGEPLSAETFRRFPYLACRAEPAARVLRGDLAARRQIEAARPGATAFALSTIGYEGRSLEAYLNALLQAGATLLCDVRLNPLSRKYGFSKRTLATACETVGIRYEHLPQLGIASEKRRNLETQADRDALFADYERHTLPRQQAALGEIRAWVRSGERVALTCYERLPEQCHRHCVAEALERLPGGRLAAKHL